MNDIFREVDEEYRHAQLLQFWHDNAPIIILTLLLAIAGAGGAGFWKSHQSVQRQKETYALTHAIDDSALQTPQQALATLNKAVPDMTGHRVIPARFALARATVMAGDKAGAIRLYDDIAVDTIATAAERDLAEIESVGLQLQDGDPAQLVARLDKLTGEKNAWRFSAREWQALLAMRQGDMQKAHDIAAALAKDSNAPDGIHERAQHLAALAGEGLAPAQDAQQSDGEPNIDLPGTK